MVYRVQEFETEYTDDTLAVQAAIDACAAAGGEVVTEENRVYHIKSLVMKSNVTLILSKGTVLQASPNLNDYVLTEDVTGRKSSMERYKGRPVHVMIYAKGEHDIAIAGEGMIDGISEAFVTQKDRYHSSGKDYPRPVILYLEDCQDITLKDFTVKDAPFWTIHPAGCRNVMIDHIKIDNRLYMANSDGIDPDHCSNVVIKNCNIQCADDCICLKNTEDNRMYGACEHILIEDCNLISTSAGVKIGTEGVDDFRHITVRNCRIRDSNRGISVQVRDQGCVSDVRFESIEIETRRFYDGWWGRGEPIYISAAARSENTKAGTIKNIHFFDINCRSENGICIYSESKSGITDIVFEQVRVFMVLEHKWPAGWYDIRPCVGEGLIRRKNHGIWNHNGKDIYLRHVRLAMPKRQVEGFGDFIGDEGNGIVEESIQCVRWEEES